MTINKNYVIRDVGGRCIAVPVGEECKRMNGMIKLNETAAFIVKSITSGHTEKETIESMTNQYEVTLEHAKEGYRKMVEKLMEIGMIEK